MQFQTKLKMLRYDRGWNQEDVATQLKISIPAYSKIETGITDLNYSRIEQLAALYQLTAVQLLDPEHDPFKKDDALIMEALRERLAKKEEQIVELQSKLISLYDGLAERTVKK